MGPDGKAVAEKCTIHLSRFGLSSAVPQRCRLAPAQGHLSKTENARILNRASVASRLTCSLSADERRMRAGIENDTLLLHALSRNLFGRRNIDYLTFSLEISHVAGVVRHLKAYGRSRERRDAFTSALKSFACRHL